MKRNLLIAVIISWVFVLTAVAAPIQAIPGRTVLIAQATQDGYYLITIALIVQFVLLHLGRVPRLTFLAFQPN